MKTSGGSLQKTNSNSNLSIGKPADMIKMGLEQVIEQTDMEQQATGQFTPQMS